MAGVPGFVHELGWWAVAIFLFLVVFVRTQATYLAGRWVRSGATKLAAEPESHPVLSRMSTRLTGPGMLKAESFLDTWGFIGIPLSFLTVGLQTLVNGAAGYSRMRWDIYTLIMLPGCVLWVAAYFAVGASVFTLWRISPWLLLGAAVTVVVVAWAGVKLRRTAGSSVRTPR
jgi:membrane protein DedA with SNARE-associated domain